MKKILLFLSFTNILFTESIRFKEIPAIGCRWGNNTYGQLGNGTNNSSNIPVKVLNITGAKKIEADSHSLALAPGFFKIDNSP